MVGCSFRFGFCFRVFITMSRVFYYRITVTASLPLPLRMPSFDYLYDLLARHLFDLSDSYLFSARAGEINDWLPKTSVCLNLLGYEVKSRYIHRTGHCLQSWQRVCAWSVLEKKTILSNKRGCQVHQNFKSHIHSSKERLRCLLFLKCLQCDA